MAAIADATMDLDRLVETRQPISFTQKLDWIPVISSIWAIFRLVIGSFELVLGSFTWPVEIIWNLRISQDHHLLFIEGILNIGRAFVAAIPFIGNWALILYDTQFYMILNLRRGPSFQEYISRQSRELRAQKTHK